MDISNYEVTLTDVAKEEIENIYAYILENLHEEIAANKLMDKREDGVLRLAQNPYLCPKVKVKPHNEIYRKLIINNYIVFFQFLLILLQANFPDCTISKIVMNHPSI